ncbi:diguanylate cyclase domain-containing protein [Cohnella endophytica]|nr:diguanylate cyclase [Cohnella endophytica]
MSLLAALAGIGGGRVTSRVVRDASKYKHAEEELQATRKAFATILREQHGLIFKFKKIDGKYRYTLADGKLYYSLGLTHSIVGKTMEEIVPERLHDYIRGNYDRAWSGECFQYESDFNDHIYLNSVTPIMENGVVTEVLVVGGEITDRKKAEQVIQESEDWYRTLIELSPDAIIVLVDSHIQLVNEKAVEVLGALRSEEIIGKTIFEFLHPEYRDLAIKHGHTIIEKRLTVQPVDSKIVRADGQIIDVEATGTRIMYNQKPSIFIIFRDITKRKLAEHQMQESNLLLSRLANLDGLTGIANRRYMNDKLEQEWVLAAARGAVPLSIVLCDIDYFKLYNDTYGHLEGDACLKRVAKVLDEYAYPSGGFAARYGGEEFLVVLPETDSAVAMRIAMELSYAVEALAIPHQASQAAEHVTISLGVATLQPSIGTPRELLIQHADEALYRAKTRGRNQMQVYSGV